MLWAAPNKQAIAVACHVLAAKESVASAAFDRVGHREMADRERSYR
jgi:hypothetical protein